LAQVFLEGRQVICVARDFVSVCGVTIHEDRLAVKFLLGFIQYLYPTPDIGARTAVYEGVAAIEKEIAQVYDVRLFEMHETVAIGMTRAVVI
jgi:hypothetical protein